MCQNLTVETRRCLRSYLDLQRILLLGWKALIKTNENLAKLRELQRGTIIWSRLVGKGTASSSCLTCRWWTMCLE